MKTIRYGCNEVEVLQRPWKRGKRIAFRTTNGFKPGESWFNAKKSAKQWEYYVLHDGKQIPAAALVAKELKEEGAIESAFVYLWGGDCTIFDESLTCVSHSGEIGTFIREVKMSNGGRLGGFPNVIAIFGDGKVDLRKTINVKAKGRISENQHKMANSLRKTYGEKVDLKVVEWDIRGYI